MAREWHYFFAGLTFGALMSLIATSIGARWHVIRIDRMVRKAERATGAAEELTAKAHRVALHAATQYEPLRSKVANLDNELKVVKQHIEEVRVLLNSVRQ